MQISTTEDRQKVECKCKHKSILKDDSPSGGAGEEGPVSFASKTKANQSWGMLHAWGPGHYQTSSKAKAGESLTDCGLA